MCTKREQMVIEPRKTRKTRKWGVGRRKEKVVRGWRAWARPRGGSAARPLRRREPLMDTNGHEWIEPRMDTKDTKKLRTTNGHEWTRKESRGLLNHEWARIPVVRGLLSSLACGLPSTMEGMQCAISSQFAHLPSGESRDGVGILVVDGVSAARCERSPR